MADNTQLNLGAGGDVIKTEDVGAFKIAVSKIYLGATGIDGGPISPTNPLPVAVGNFPATQPVSGTVSVGNFPATQPVSGSVSVGNFPATQPVSGTVGVGNFPATQAVSALSLPLPSGAATALKQPAFAIAGTPASDVLTVQGTAAMTPLKVDGSASTQPVSGTVGISGTVPVTGTFFLATQPVSGTVSVGNFPATQPVSVGNFPATQAVSGSVSVGNFPATQAVTVGNFPATQAVSGTVSVGNFPATQAVSLSSAPLPAGAAVASKQPAFTIAGTSSPDVLTVQGASAMTPLKVDGSASTQPVSGTVSVGNFPATQAVSGSVSVGNFPATQAVTVGNFPATQPVSVGNFPATQAVSGSVTVGNFPATQAVSGTVIIGGSVSTVANLNVANAAVGVGNPVPVATVAPLPSGSNTIGAVLAHQTTGVVFNGSTAITPKFAAISASLSGDNPIVAAVAGKRIRVLKYTIVTSGAVLTRFRTSSGADLTGAMSLAANSGVGGAFCPVGLFETEVGDALNLSLSSAVGVAGHLTYIEV